MTDALHIALDTSSLRQRCCHFAITLHVFHICRPQRRGPGPRACTFCRRHRQSRDMARFAKSRKESFWTGPLSGATPEASFMTDCIRELLGPPLDPGAAVGPPPQTQLHAGREKTTMFKITRRTHISYIMLMCLSH